MNWGKMALCMFAVVYLNSMGTFFQKHIFVCVSGIPESIKMLKLRALFPDHSPSSCPTLKHSYLRLLRYESGWIANLTGGHKDIWTYKTNY